MVWPAGGKPAGMAMGNPGTVPDGQMRAAVCAMMDRPRLVRRRHCAMPDTHPKLPELAVNRPFMAAFLAEEPSCMALGMVADGASRCAMVALRLEQALPRHVSAAGFGFGHALYGAGDWVVVHFAFAFYGFATYHALINPSDPMAGSVLNAMVATGDYFFFTLDADRGATAFRSSLGADNLAGLRTNMHRIQGSVTTDAQYRRAVAQFSKHPEPPGTLLSWVCRGRPDYLDLEQDRLVLRPT